MLRIPKSDAIAILQTPLQEIDQWGFDPQVWKNRIEIDLKRIFSTHEQWLQISRIRFDTYIKAEKAKKLLEGKNTAKRSIASYIDMIEEYGVIQEKQKNVVEETYKEKYAQLSSDWNKIIPQVKEIREKNEKYLEDQEFLLDRIDELELQLKEKEEKEDFFPSEIISNTRGYLENTGKQAILSYQNGIYDGCLVLVRKLIEGLIIECFEKHGVSDNIKDKEGNFFHLSDLINLAINEKSWNVGRNFKQACPNIKKFGDLAAHNRRFNARKLDVDSIKDDIRIVVEELVHIAGFDQKLND